MTICMISGISHYSYIKMYYYIIIIIIMKKMDLKYHKRLRGKKDELCYRFFVAWRIYMYIIQSRWLNIANYIKQQQNFQK